MLIKLVSAFALQALSTKRDTPWNVNRHTLVHAAIFMQLAWFSSELVLASTAVALAPRIMGKQLCTHLSIDDITTPCHNSLYCCCLHPTHGNLCKCLQAMMVMISTEHSHSSNVHIMMG